MPTEDADTKFAQRVKQLREAAKMSQADLCEQLAKHGVNFQATTIYKIEQGRRKVTVAEAVALASALDYTLDTMIGGPTKFISAGTLQSKASTAFTYEARDYALTLLALAVAADTVTIRDADRDWLSTELANQTPAQLTTNAKMHVDAAIIRNGDDPNGKYVSTLLENLARDEEILNAHKLDHTEWRRRRREQASDG